MRWRAKLLLLGSAAALAGSIPALSQEAPPVLPPGFGDPEPQPDVPVEDAPVTEPVSTPDDEPTRSAPARTRSSGGERSLRRSATFAAVRSS